MSTRKKEQDNNKQEAVDWNYDKMANGVNVKFPPLDSDDLPHDCLNQYDLRRLRNVWNKHSRHWDVQHKIDIIDYLWDPSVTKDLAWIARKHPLYPKRSSFSAYVILKCLYPTDPDLGPHRFIRWGKYPEIDRDANQATDCNGNPVAFWGSFEPPVAQDYQCSVNDVEAVNEGVHDSVQDEPDESLKTKNKVIVHDPWWNTKHASLSLALDQQNNKNADAPSEEAAMPGTWDPLPVRQAWGRSQCSPPPDDQHYQRQSRSGWGSNNEKCAWGLPAANRIYAAPDLEYVESKEMAHQETTAEDDRADDACGYPRQSGRSACKGHDAFASKFSSETEDSEVGVITPASSNTEHTPVLSSQQIQELKDFITKTNNDTVAHLSLEMSHMKKSLDEKIEQMREDFNLRLNRAMKVNRSLRDDMETLQLSLPDNPTTQQQVRELEARVANLEQWCPDF
ncbi:uncharacterized protein FIESC28_02539 [Fusarium coffeatum]|uniref:Uncharacterized protein n=1 Tax=Fusarium coffeatum TaxID=231269 RepID=A0A366S7E5_9HYPO|nr:uncharacterized protein FIESC28_02539 [Fusarium coffeatum]RBR24606.1 hypothetical protein FIESC28_02539 [Fusarium coffeatum]